MTDRPWPTTAVSVSHVGDLIVVKQNSVTYVTGEVAHIDSILDGEFHERRHTRTTTLETSQTVETEEEQETERDLQTTEKFELQRESQEVLKERTQLQAGLKVTAQYGNPNMGPFVKAEGELGYTSTTEGERTQRSSSRFAREVVERSLERIKSRTKEVRARRSVEEVREEITHRRDNPSGQGDKSGAYHWVDKIYQLQKYNYGRRLFLDVFVPDPGANLRFLRTYESPAGMTIARPADFVITADDVTEITINDYMALWNASDVNPPPPEWLTVAHTARIKPAAGGALGLEANTGTVRIPQGYRAVQAEAIAEMAAGTNLHTWWVRASLGDALVGLSRRNARSVIPSDLLRGPEIPVAVYAYVHHESAVTLSVLCQRAEAYRSWQLDTFQSLYQAYQAQKSAFDEALANARLSQGGVIGSNPALNRQRERDELTRSCIELLRRQLMSAADTTTVGGDGRPLLSFANVDAAVTGVAFFSQAFEWDNLGFELLPYFWSDPGGWARVVSEGDPDPMHESFLQAGWARVSIPVTPGFEGAVLYFVDNDAAIWNEPTDPPQRAERGPLVALLQDIDGHLGVDRQPRPEGNPWTVRVPTELVVLNAAALPPNPIPLA